MFQSTNDIREWKLSRKHVTEKLYPSQNPLNDKKI